MAKPAPKFASKDIIEKQVLCIFNMTIAVITFINNHETSNLPLLISWNFL